MLIEAADLTPQEKKLIDEIISVFSSEPEVQQIRLFGSRARGSSTDKSDLDILVLYDGNLGSFDSLRKKALQEIDDYIYVNIVPYEVSRYNKSRHMFRGNIERDGIVIWKRQ